MSLDQSYLDYPQRRHGMDHDRYLWSMLEQRATLRWPDDRPLALWINLCLEHFPLNPRGDGLKAPGAMSMPYPDLRHYTLRDYGNRVGVYRILDALERYGLRASLAINAELIERYPRLIDDLLASGHEWIAHGWNMDCVHHGGMQPEAEQELIGRSLSTLRQRAPNPLRGWLSPAHSQSAQTTTLLRRAGIDWCADWVNDELPYLHDTQAGELINLPLSVELEDQFVVGQNLHAESEYADQLIDACEFLRKEAVDLGQGRILALNLHAWVMGQPHRIGHLERVFAHLAEGAKQIWNPTPSELVDHAHMALALIVKESK